MGWKEVSGVLEEERVITKGLVYGLRATWKMVSMAGDRVHERFCVEGRPNRHVTAPIKLGERRRTRPWTRRGQRRARRAQRLGCRRWVARFAE